MKSSIETLNPTRVRLTVEVPFTELKPSVDEAYKKIGAQISIPGFRKGRVPALVIDQRVGRGVVLDEAVNEHLPKAYSAAVDEHRVKPVGQPDVDVTAFTDGSDLTFTAEVDVRPELDLPDYVGIPVQVDDADVSDDEVAEQLHSLRGRFGSLTDVQRPAAVGDFVTLDLTATDGGEPVPDATATGLSYEVGSGQLLDGLDELLVGLSSGESAQLRAPVRADDTTSGEHDHDGDGAASAGETATARREVDVTATVRAVRERTLPEADDDFAQMASEFDTLSELTADLRRRVSTVKQLQQGAQARDKVLDALLGMVQVPLPERLVQAQVTEHFQDGHGDEEHRGEFETQARKALTAQFLLDAIAVKEELSVGEGELSEYIVRNASRYGMSPDTFAQEIVSAGQVPAVVGEVVRAKALAYVLEHAKVTDTSGRSVNLDALREEATARTAD